MKTKMPAKSKVAAELTFLIADLAGTEDYLDVRLQVREATSFPFVGEWAIHTGDASYDTDHRGYWGASCVTADSDPLEVADDLVEQAADHAAQVES